MQVLIETWGDSAVVRIPTTVMIAASLSVSQGVEVREENGRVVIEPIQSFTYTLNELLADMRPETFPGNEDWDPVVGQEVW